MKRLNRLSDMHWTAIVWFLSLAFYSVTLAPTVIWGDSANFALMVDQFLLDPAADGHPLYIILGKVFSWLPGELAVNLNFMSAFFASLTTALLFLAVLLVTESRPAGLLGAVTLSVSHSFWLHAVTTEVYTINTFFIFAIVCLMLQWKKERRDGLLYWAAFIYGLSLSHHLIIGLMGVAVLYFLFTYDRAIFTDRRIFILFGCFFLGLTVYFGVMLNWVLQQPEKSSEIVDIATGRGHKEYMLNYRISWVIENIVMYAAYLFYQFPVAGFALGGVGIYAFFKEDKRLAWYFLLIILLNAGFFIGGPRTWGSPNYTFYIQDYAVFSLFIAYGCHYLITKKGESLAQWLMVALLLCPIFTYQVTPALSKALGLDLLRTRQLPFRNNEEFFLNPSKLCYYGPKRYAMLALGQLEKNATIIADYTPAAVLDYYQNVLGVRRDVKLVYVQDAAGGVENYDLKPFVDEHYDKGPVYLADLAGPGYYNVENLVLEYRLEKRPPIYKVIKKDVE